MACASNQASNHIIGLKGELISRGSFFVFLICCLPAVTGLNYLLKNFDKVLPDEPWMSFTKERDGTTQRGAIETQSASMLCLDENGRMDASFLAAHETRETHVAVGSDCLDQNCFATTLGELFEELATERTAYEGLNS